MSLTVICGFPGIGKTHLAALAGWHDSDSSAFSWSSPGVRNPAFPTNYIAHIQGLSGVVLASSHKVVRDALADAGIEPLLCYPRADCQEEYLARYRKRGSPEAFITLLEKQWGTWITEMQEDPRCAGRIVLQPGQYASDRLFQ